MAFAVGKSVIQTETGVNYITENHDKLNYSAKGYFADLVIVNSGLPWTVKKDNIFAKCGWSPFEDFTFRSRITHTFVNGQLVFQNFKVKDIRCGKRLLFDR